MSSDSSADSTADAGVLRALARPDVDWRTPEMIANETGLGLLEVAAAFDRLGDLVRHPVGNRGAEQHLYRLACRPRTLGEKLRFIRAMLVRG